MSLLQSVSSAKSMMNVALKLCLSFVEDSQNYTKMFIVWHLSPYYDVLLPTRGAIPETIKYGFMGKMWNFSLFIERNDTYKL